MLGNSGSEKIIPKIDDGIVKEKESIVKYLSDDFYLKFQLREILDISSSENEIIITAKNVNDKELFIYEKEMKFKDFIKFKKIFGQCENIEEVFAILSEKCDKKNVFIKEINYENYLLLGIESEISSLKKSFSADIKLLKRNCNIEEVNGNLQRKINKLEKQLQDKNQKIIKLEKENENLRKRCETLSTNTSSQYITSFSYYVNDKKYIVPLKDMKILKRINNSSTVCITLPVNSSVIVIDDGDYLYYENTTNSPKRLEIYTDLVRYYSMGLCNKGNVSFWGNNIHFSLKKINITSNKYE